MNRHIVFSTSFIFIVFVEDTMEIDANKITNENKPVKKKKNLEAHETPPPSDNRAIAFRLSRPLKITESKLPVSFTMLTTKARTFSVKVFLHTRQSLPNKVRILRERHMTTDRVYSNKKLLNYFEEGKR